MTKLEELISKVRKIDPEAADYLVEEAPKLKSYSNAPDENNELNNLFSWKYSKQGHKFWSNIDRQLNAKDKN